MKFYDNNIPATLAAARQEIQSLFCHLESLNVSSDNRNLIAGAAFSLSIQHADAIITLLQQGLVLSGATLMRPMFEARIRGRWYLECATIEQVNEPEKNKQGLERILNSKSLKTELDVFLMNKEKLDEFVHSNMIQLSRNLSDVAIEPNVSSDEVIEILRFSVEQAYCAAISCAIIAGNIDVHATLTKNLAKIRAENQSP